VTALVSAFGDREPEVVRIRFRDAPGPALLARSVWDEAAGLRGDTGARALFDAQPERVRWVALDEDAPVDVDRQADIDRA
jgi:CTP:molybdopterin cytidylyltransferase MocA